MANVGGVADLAHLAIAHHIHTGVNLLGHDLVGFFDHDAIKVRFDVIEARVLRKELSNDALRAWQAADVCGEDTVGHVLALYKNELAL
jgi:hypothetical protein